MNLMQATVGIDPSGRRLAIAAVRAGLGGPAPCAPPVVIELRGDREPARLEEAAAAVGEFVARHGLAGSGARLCLPADRVYFARASFPPLKDKDLRAAVELELERLFPFPPSALRFGWRRAGARSSGGKEIALVVAAAPADYVERWVEIAARAGLRLAAAVPSAWAVAGAWSALAAGRLPSDPVAAVLRDAGGAVECTVLAGGEPIYSAARACPAERMPEEGLALLEAGLIDAPSPGAGIPVALAAPSGWIPDEGTAGGGGSPVRRVADFEARAAKVLPGPGGAEDAAGAWSVLGAYGAAAAGEKALDLLETRGEGAGPLLARSAVWVLAAATLLLAVAWPATVAWRTKAELGRLDSEIAALRPAVAGVEESLGDLAWFGDRTAVLAQAAAGRAEAIDVLRELTDRLPQGTWLTGLRVEERKVEMDGLSPSASEIFPLLTRDGRFRGVEFASPVTRQPDNIERFKIRAEYVPAEPEAGR